MRRYFKGILLPGLLIVGVLGALPVRGIADEEEIPLRQVPRAAKATIVKAAEGAAIREIERETEGDRTVYEVEIEVGGKTIEITVAQNGDLLEMEIEGGKEEEDNGEDNGENEDGLSLRDIPRAARKALRRLAHRHEILEVEREREYGITLYEVEWEAGGHEYEAKVTADGTLVEIEKTVDFKVLPKAVRRAGAKVCGHKKPSECARKKVVIYEIEYEEEGGEVEALILPTGKVIEAEHEEEGDEEEEDDDNGKDDDSDDDGEDEDDDENGDEDDDNCDDDDDD